MWMAAYVLPRWALRLRIEKDLQMIDTTYINTEIHHYGNLRHTFFDEQVSLVTQEEIRIECKCDSLYGESYLVKWRVLYGRK